MHLQMQGTSDSPEELAEHRRNCERGACRRLGKDFGSVGEPDANDAAWILDAEIAWDGKWSVSMRKSMGDDHGRRRWRHRSAREKLLCG